MFRRATEQQPVAIVGLGGRFPGANDLATFWSNLQSGKACIIEIPSERWDYRQSFDARKGVPGKSYSKWGGFIDLRRPAVDAGLETQIASMPNDARLFAGIVNGLLSGAGPSATSLAQRCSRVPC